MAELKRSKKGIGFSGKTGKPMRSLKDPNVEKRLKRRISFLKATGNNKSQIAKILDISYSSVNKYLEMEDVTQRIEDLFSDAMESAERQFALAFTAMPARMVQIIKNGDELNSIKAMELLLKAQGRMQEKGPSQGMIEQMMQQQGGGFVAAGPLTPDAAQRAMDFLVSTPKEKNITPKKE